LLVFPATTIHSFQHQFAAAYYSMGRKRSRARVSRYSDSDGGEEEGAAAVAPSATGSSSLYEVWRLQTLAGITAERRGREVACWVGLFCCVRERDSNLASEI
jgi:hypothetical protein